MGEVVQKKIFQEWTGSTKDTSVSLEWYLINTYQYNMSIGRVNDVNLSFELETR